jgi:hypothetical protein
VSGQLAFRGRAPGNREVSRLWILAELGHMRAVLGEAYLGRRGLMGETWFPPWERSDERGVFA